MSRMVRKMTVAVLMTAMALFTAVVAEANCAPGDKAQVLWKGTWYPASVLQAKGNRCFIHYDGYGSNWDEWVGPDRIRITSVSAPAAAPAPSGAINVSCGDSVKSLNKTATMDFTVVCPVNCNSGSIWGTDLYTTDSSICRAAIHSGVIKENGGAVRVNLAPGQPAYTGTFKNGVTTSNWGSYDQSFKVLK